LIPPETGDNGTPDAGAVPGLDTPDAGTPDAAEPEADGVAARADADSAADSAEPADPDAIPLDADGQPRLTLFGLSGRVLPAVYLAAWIISIIGAGTITVSILGARNPSARWLFVIGLVLLALGLLAAAGSQATERMRRPSLPFGGPSPVLAFGAIVCITLLATLLVLGPLSALGIDPGGPLGTVVSLAVTTLVFVGVVRVLVVGPGALSWAEIGFSRTLPGALADTASGALLAVPVVIAEIVLLAALVPFLGGQPASPLPPASSVSSLIFNLLSASILAPLGEEVFFRGYTTTAWARAVGARAAIIRGALFFSFAHIATLFATTAASGLQTAIAQYVALLPAGLALGWVFLARRSIWASIGLHGTYNAIIVLLAYAATAAQR
jgi:uncharacterized protein